MNQVPKESTADSYLIIYTNPVQLNHTYKHLGTKSNNKQFYLGKHITFIITENKRYFPKIE